MFEFLGVILSLIWSILKGAFLILKTFNYIKVEMIAFLLGVPVFVAWILCKMLKLLKK